MHMMCGYGCVVTPHSLTFHSQVPLGHTGDYVFDAMCKASTNITDKGMYLEVWWHYHDRGFSWQRYVITNFTQIIQPPACTTRKNVQH